MKRLNILKAKNDMKRGVKMAREDGIYAMRFASQQMLIDKLQQENKQLKDNWDKLKEYCKENTLCYEVGDDENTKLIGSKIHGLNVLDKMQELEKSDSNE